MRVNVWNNIKKLKKIKKISHSLGWPIIETIVFDSKKIIVGKTVINDKI